MLTPKYIRAKIDIESIPLRNKLREAGIDRSMSEVPPMPINKNNGLIDMLDNMDGTPSISTGNAKADLV